MTPEPPRCPTCGHTTDTHGTTGCTYIYVIDSKDVVCSCSPDTQPLHPDWLTSTIAPTPDPTEVFEHFLDTIIGYAADHGYSTGLVANLTEQTAELRIYPNTGPAWVAVGRDGNLTGPPYTADHMARGARITTTRQPTYPPPAEGPFTCDVCATTQGTALTSTGMMLCLTHWNTQFPASNQPKPPAPAYPHPDAGPPDPTALCACGHPWIAHDVEYHHGDRTDLCCAVDCDQNGCPGKDTSS